MNMASTEDSVGLQPWHKDISMEFLELYRNERLLWDPKHSHHKNKHEVNEAWIRIQSAMSIECTVRDLKRKKESLMATFRLLYHKKRSRSKGFISTWFAFAFMESFLSEKYDFELSELNQTPKQELYTDDQEYPNSITKRKRTSFGIKIPTPTVVDQVNNNGSRYKQLNVSEPVLRSEADDHREIDECELYGQLLARKLRRLSERQRDMAMHKIDNILFQAIYDVNRQQSQELNYDFPRKVKSPLFIVSEPNQEKYEDVTYLEDPMQD